MRYGLARRFVILALVALSAGSLLFVFVWVGAAGSDLATSYSRGVGVFALWAPTIELAWVLGTLAILIVWKPILAVPLFVGSCLVLVVAGLLLLEVRDDGKLMGPAVVVVVACVGLFLGGWFISKAAWPPELHEG